jgi:hypothetical protein
MQGNFIGKFIKGLFKRNKADEHIIKANTDKVKVSQERPARKSVKNKQNNSWPMRLYQTSLSKANRQGLLPEIKHFGNFNPVKYF